MLVVILLGLSGCGPTVAPIGTPFPSLRAEAWVNGELTDDQLKGNVTVVELFATWCGPCAEQTPELIEVYEEFQPRGVLFLSLTAESTADIDLVKNFADQLHVPWPIGVGATPTILELKAELVPTTFVIGKEGTILWHSLNGGSLRAVLDQALL